MIYAFQLGPIPTGEGDAHFFLTVNEQGFVEPLSSKDAQQALWALAGRAGGAANVRCHPNLAAAGKELGIQSAPVPPQARDAIVGLALAMAYGSDVSPDPAALQELFHASLAYFEAAPWERWHSGQPIAIAVSSGGKRTTYEASVLGAGGEEYGLALYSRKGAIAEVERLVEAGRFEDGMNIDSLALLFDEEPAFAAKALREAVGFELVPLPMKIRKGRSAKLRTSELLTLAAALRAVACMPDEAKSSSAEAGEGRARTRAEVAAPSEPIH